jgi:crossover junction endodeoxyribonuclease RusA
MPNQITITLPWPPSVNRYWRRVGNRTLISAEGRSYKRQVATLAMTANRSAWPLTGPLSMGIVLNPPDYRRRDIDNTQKAILDALQAAGAYQDDYQIEELQIIRSTVVKGGKVAVVVMQLPLVEKKRNKEPDHA